jgi:hypothetical protein
MWSERFDPRFLLEHSTTPVGPREAYRTLDRGHTEFSHREANANTERRANDQDGIRP